MTVAGAHRRCFVALAQKLHHTSRGQANARAGEWGREMNFAATIRDPPFSPSSHTHTHSPAGALQPLRRRARRWAVTVGHGPCAAGAGCSGTPWCTGSRRSHSCNQLVEAFQYLDLPIPEQVIEVPKISSSSRRSRRRRVPLVQQTAEQLVEVTTIVSFSSLHGLVERNVDIPVPHGWGGWGGGGVFMVYAQDRFLLLHPLTHLVLRTRFSQGFSHFSPT